MSKLVDADALEVVTAKVPKGMDAKSYMEGMEYVLNQINALPTIEERKTGKWSGLWSEPEDDKQIYGEKLIEGDTIYLLGIEGTVRQENGAWGWASCNYVPWDELVSKMPHNNSPSFCYCDNFVSFWELKWNFDDGDDWDGVPYIRHNCGVKMERKQT